MQSQAVDKMTSRASPSVIGGTMIIAGTAIGAGMFSLPTVSSGMWFSWSLVAMLFTWFCMFHSCLMILETNLHYPVGSSFDTFVGDILGKGWNLATGLSVIFVFYILLYAYISGGGSIVIHTLESTVGAAPPPAIASLIFALSLAFVVWISTTSVSRITTVLIGGMVVTFFIAMSDLTFSIKTSILFNTEETGVEYFPFAFAALPFFLTSFAFHGSVPSLMRFYGKEPIMIRNCLLYGSLLALSAYVLWLASILGNIPRVQFTEIVAAGGNVGVLLTAVSNVIDGQNMEVLLNLFANLAIVSSFLGVSLGLFDYIADKFKFDDSHLGRTKTALITFAPPTVGGLFFPDGFLYAISFAGLAAVLFVAIVPALLVRQCRIRFDNSLYRVWGGNGMIYLIMGFGIVYGACHILAMVGLLPVFGK